MNRGEIKQYVPRGLHAVTSGLLFSSVMAKLYTQRGFANANNGVLTWKACISHTIVQQKEYL